MPLINIIGNPVTNQISYEKIGMMEIRNQNKYMGHKTKIEKKNSLLKVTLFCFSKQINFFLAKSLTTIEPKYKAKNTINTSAL